MPAVAGRGDDESKTQPQLFNVANRGLSLMTRSGALQPAADCSIVLLGSARSSQHNLKGYVFGLKFYPSRCKEVCSELEMSCYYNAFFQVVFVDKGSLKSPDRFEKCVDAQSSFDCNFQIIGGAVFGKFISKLITQVQTFLIETLCF